MLSFVSYSIIQLVVEKTCTLHIFNMDRIVCCPSTKLDQKFQCEYCGNYNHFECLLVDERNINCRECYRAPTPLHWRIVAQTGIHNIGIALDLDSIFFFYSARLRQRVETTLKILKVEVINASAADAYQQIPSPL